jgi:hypothetical protein
MQLNRQILEAIKNGDLDTLSRLVGNDESLRNGPNAFGSWLHDASTKGQLGIVKYLVENGANVNHRGDTFDAEPITYAAFYGHIQVIEYLLSHGATLDVSSPDRNPLFKTISKGRADVAKFLLDAGVDANVVYRSVTGKLKNALSYAQERGEKEIADLLIKAGCRLPIEGVDKPVWQPEKIDEPTAEDKAHEQIISHLSELFGPVDPLALQEIFPVHGEVYVAINVIRPNDRHPFLTLFTTGMSDKAMNVPKGQEEYQYAELLMHLPANWPHPRDKAAGEDALWPLEWLRKVAYYPHLNDTWLGGPMTIISSDDPPVPLGPNTKQTCLLLLAGVTDWNPLTLKDRRSVFFYTVIPIYTEERDFEMKHGIMPLVERLKERGYSAVVDIHRPSVAVD